MAKDRDTATRIALEHAAVRNVIRDVRSELERWRDRPTPAHPVGRLGDLLTDLAEHLRRHFRLEEEGGYLSVDPELDPGKRRIVQTLLDQHRDFERRLAAVLDRARRAEEAGVRLPQDFAATVDELLDEIRRHESAENELLQKLVLHDLGGGD